MPFGRPRQLFLTLRSRLTAWVTFVVFLVVAIAFFSVRGLVRQALEHEFDQRLLRDADEARLAFKQYFPFQEQFYQAMNRKAQGHLHVGWFVQLYDDKGKMKWATEGAPSLAPPLPSSGPTVLADEGQYRTVQTELDEGEVHDLRIRVGSTRLSFLSDLQLVDRILLLGGIAMLVLAPVGGYLLAGRATKPLAQIISTTSQLQPKKLDERLPISGSGDELDQLSRTINGMLDRIAAYLESNRDFIANAAHELRSPLAAIRSSVDVALDRLRTPDEYAALLTDVAEECARLTNLLNRLMLLAEGDAGGLALSGQQASLDKIVRESVDMFGPVADAQGVELKVDHLPSVVVMGDEYYLRQVVRNLLDNAIKFTPQTGQVTVDLSADPSRRQAVLRVADTGVGIPPEEQPRIFERFYRVDKSRRREGGPGGNGLGLAICQAVVTALRGEIQVYSLPGNGSTFTVTLPLKDGSGT